MSDIEFVAEDEAEADAGLKLEEFSQAVLWGTDWTVETVLAQLQRKNIELNPKFQRRDAWGRLAKSRFIESVILGLPIPQVVLAESKEQRGRYIILDGKQRLLSLMQFAGMAEDGPNNGFGLSGLDVRKDLTRKRFKNFEEDPKLRRDFDALMTHTIRTTVIRNWPSLAFLHIVFQRLNTGSLKLSPQELRQAVVPGPFTEFADDATQAAPEIWSLLSRSSPDPRMRDVELLVRGLSLHFRLEAYAGRMKDFLDDSCLDFNKHWDEQSEDFVRAVDRFRIGITLLNDILGDRLARKSGSALFNRSSFDSLIYYAMFPAVFEAMSANRAAVSTAYDTILADPSYIEAAESDTAGIPNTHIRLSTWGLALQEALKIPVPVPALQENEHGQLRFVVG